MNFFAVFISGMLVALTGCAFQSTDGGTHDSISQRYPEIVRGMADTAAMELIHQYSPEKTALTLNKASGLFGETLETRLRSKGFALLPPETPGIQISYVLDILSGEATPTAYLRMHTSDGCQFSVIRRLQDSSASTPEKASVTSTPLTAPAVPAPHVTGNQNALLPKAVLTSLPYDWRYQIPDAEKRALRVSWPKNVPWREAIRGMATEAGCTAQFDESARRVTLVAADTRRPILTASTASVSAPVAPVSALHPASLPEPSLPEHTVSTAITQKPEVKVEPKVIQDALTGSGAGVSSPPLPVIPASSLASTSHVPPAKTEESDGSDSLLLQTSKASLSEEAWTLESGSLYAQLGAWTERAGYQLVWKAPDDLGMSARSTFHGSFVKVIHTLFKGLQKAGHPFAVTIYEDNNVMEVRSE